MHLHLSSFVWNAAQTTSWSGLSDRIYIRLECVSEGIYTWSFQDRIAIRSKEMHEVTRCKRPHIDKDRITDRQKEWYIDRQTDRQIGNGSVMSRDVTIHSTHDSIWFTILITWYNYFLTKWDLWQIINEKVSFLLLGQKLHISLWNWNILNNTSKLKF